MRAAGLTYAAESRHLSTLARDIGLLSTDTNIASLETRL